MLIPDSNTLNVAIVGCGAVTELFYRPALQELERTGLIRVNALFDPNYEQVEELKTHFSSACCLNDLAELRRLNIELAIVASPVRYHAEQTIQILRSGIAVLCEKPMAATVAEAESMIEEATLAKRVLAVGLFRRFFPACQTIREILSLNILGEVESFEFWEGYKFAWPAKSDSFFRKATAQGGVLLDIGVHVLDLLVWWFGQPKEVFYEDDAMGGLEASCYIKLKFPQGFKGKVRLSRDMPLPNRCVIKCEKGWLSWDVTSANNLDIGFYNTRYALRGQLYNGLRKNSFPVVGPIGSSLEQSFVFQLLNIVGAIRGTEEVFISGEQGIQSLRIIERCYRHRELMNIPWLSEDEYSQAKQLNRQC